MNLKLNHIINKALFAVSLLATILVTSSCKQDDQIAKEEAPAINESEALYNFFIENGDYINSPGAPAVMTAAALFNMLDKNIHIIDLREPDQYKEGHIEGAVNITPDKLIEYFENTIDAPFFERIILVCSRGQLSAYTTGIMQLLGYNNTYSVRYGMNAWNSKLAKGGWDNVTAAFPKDLTHAPSVELSGKHGLPVLSTGGKNGYEVARLRAIELLGDENLSFWINYEDVMKAPENFNLVAYVPEEWFNKTVHPEGTILFQPKKALKTGASLDLLDANKPVALYCFNGHHSANATAWLQMMGYDARSIIYGANSFMHGYFSKDDIGTPREWSDAQKNDFPLSSGGSTPAQQEDKKVVVKQTQGGC